MILFRNLAIKNTYSSTSGDDINTQMNYLESNSQFKNTNDQYFTEKH